MPRNYLLLAPLPSLPPPHLLVPVTHQRRQQNKHEKTCRQIPTSLHRLRFPPSAGFRFATSAPDSATTSTRRPIAARSAALTKSRKFTIRPITTPKSCIAGVPAYPLQGDLYPPSRPIISDRHSTVKENPLKISCQHLSTIMHEKNGAKGHIQIQRVGGQPPPGPLGLLSCGPATGLSPAPCGPVGGLRGRRHAGGAAVEAWRA